MPATYPARTPSRATSAVPLTRHPRISVLLPVRNEGSTIERVLEQLLSQDYPADRFEVIVADGMSEDQTANIARSLQRRHANLKLVANPFRWSSAGRNAAYRHSSGDIILIVDGHCDLNSRCYLSDLAETFARTGADAVGRPQPLDVSQAASFQRAVAAARSSWLGHHPDSHIYSSSDGWVRPQSVAIAYRRSVFERIGLFDEQFDACEDVEFNHRLEQAGLRCWLSQAAQVTYHPRASLAGLFRQLFRYGRGRRRLLNKHPGTFTFLGFVPAFFAAGLICGPCMMWFWPSLAWLYGGSLATYALTLVLASVSIGRRRRDALIIGRLPLIFMTIHLAAGTGIIAESLCQCAGRARRRNGFGGHER